MLKSLAIRRLFFTLLFLSSALQGGQTLDEMFGALELAANIDKRDSALFPVTYNHLLSTGYFVTHSSRMTGCGSLGMGFAHAPPYFHTNARVQPFGHLEFTANYRVFLHCPDSSIGHLGFGNYADRCANVKFAIFTPEQSCYHFPGLAFGIDDFMGSKKFTTYYLVATQVFRDSGFEGSFGWGCGRYSHGPSNGFFGGINWFPFWESCHKWRRGLGFSAEYDPTNYKKDPHPLMTTTRMRLNWGFKYLYGDFFEISAAVIRKNQLALAGSLQYNWGSSTGFLPKVNDPPIYCAPANTEPLGAYRPEGVMIQEMNYAFEAQGFQLTKAWICPRACSKTLYLTLFNCRYRQEKIIRHRLQSLLAYLTPEDISDIVVVIESFGLPCQQYSYNRDLLLRSAAHAISPYEFDVLTPRENVRRPDCHPTELVFQSRQRICEAALSPRVETFFGNAKGKFKYDVGLKGHIEGFFPGNWFYELQASYTLLSTLNDIADFDFFHPSQLPNVATDYIRYRQRSAFTWDRLYMQKSWNCGCGFFARTALGYFQANYAGVAGELLCYPAHSCLAIGIEGAVVKKRRYSGLGFQSKLRKFQGYKPIFFPYTTLQQYFLNIYLDFPSFCFFTRLSLGQFLARDKGMRLELTRYFENGVRLTGWITYTNANDQIHRRKYFDRGIAVEIPLDIFYKCSSRRVWNYAMAAWLRDAGYATTTGRPLFDTINRERR